MVSFVLWTKILNTSSILFFLNKKMDTITCNYGLYKLNTSGIFYFVNKIIEQRFV